MQGASATLSGLTITGGNASYGGGVANYGGTLSLTGCIDHRQLCRLIRWWRIQQTGHDHADRLHRQRQLRRCLGGGLGTVGLGGINTLTLTNCTVSGNTSRPQMAVGCTIGTVPPR